jgi:hypothetical protein
MTFGVAPSVAWPSERVTGWSIRVVDFRAKGRIPPGATHEIIQPTVCQTVKSRLPVLCVAPVPALKSSPEQPSWPPDCRSCRGGHLFQVASDGTGSHFPSRPSGRDDLSGRSGAAASAGKMRISHSHIPVAWSGISGCRPGTAERLSCKVAHHARIHLQIALFP